MPASRVPALVTAPPVVFVIVVGVCAATLPLVFLLGRHWTPTMLAAIALAGQAVLALVLAIIHRDQPSPLRRALVNSGLVAMGLSTGLLGWFFGPHSAFCAIVAVLIIVTGVLSGGGPAPRPTLGGWLTYLALAIGQAGVTALVLAGALPDHSLTPVKIPGHPMWHHVVSHASLQVVFLVALLIGRAFQRRYAVLASQVNDAMRAAALREALLGEARAEYRQALAAGRSGVFSGETVVGFRLGKLLDRGEGQEIYEGVHVDAGTRAAVTLRQGDSRSGATVSNVVAQAARPIGDDLATLLERGPLPAAELRRLVVDVSGALATLHATGAVHFDVNPGTIVRVVDEGGVASWRLADFGVAQLHAAFSADARALGALRYLAPERLGGLVADASADLYGLAASLYAAVTGFDPFGELAPALLPGAVLADLPLAPRLLVDVSEDVEDALRIGLAKAPADRFASATTLRDAMAAALDGRLPPADRERAHTLARKAPWRVSAPAPARAERDHADDTEVDAIAPAPARLAPVASVTGPEPTVRALPRPEPAPIFKPAHIPEGVWQEAYRSKMRGFYLGITTLSVGGALLLGVQSREPGPLVVAYVCIAGIVAAAWIHRHITLRRSAEGSYWLWALIGVLSAGPAYAFGIISGFGAVVAIWLFSGGMFRAAQRVTWRDHRGLVLAGLLLAHTVVFVLVLLGAIPDAGNAAVRGQGATAWQTVILYLLVTIIYLGAFAAGMLVDRRYSALTKRAEAAIRSAARGEALLATARAQLDRALADESSGIFTGLTIGRYELGRVLGRGGMGEVYEAKQADTGRRVAFKLIRGDCVAQPKHLRLFLDEADALSRVDSPHVAQVLDFAGFENELPYLAMEYIDGRPLADLLRERSRLSLDEVRAMVQSVGRGLRDVHAAGVVHCDLKPSNVILTTADPEAPWKIVDFGVARLLDTAAARARGDGGGTPAYMAPEQALGESVDARSDLYSLCVVAYRALTGRPPFLGHDPAAIARAILSAGPPDPRGYVDLPADVVLALRLGLSSRADERFQTAVELVVAFDHAFEGRLSPDLRRRAREQLRRQPWAPALVS